MLLFIQRRDKLMTVKFSPECIVPITHLRKYFANYLEKARKEPVAIQRNGVITHVLVSLEDYKELMRKKESPGKIRKSLPP